MSGLFLSKTHQEGQRLESGPSIEDQPAYGQIPLLEKDRLGGDHWPRADPEESMGETAVGGHQGVVQAWKERIAKEEIQVWFAASLLMLEASGPGRYIPRPLEKLQQRRYSLGGGSSEH